MASKDYKFEGWMGLDKNSAEGNLVWQEFTPKTWEERDIDIKITHCGIFMSDSYILKSGWGPTNYPCCAGHEIVGVAVRVGSEAVGGFKVGDRVGVGAQSDSCQGRNGDCDECAAGMEHFCPNNIVGTFDAKHFNGDKSYGGFALYNRTPSRFVFKIPDALPSAHAAPMLCAGITMYSALKNYGCGPGKKVGILGLGGLGHFGILWVKALNAEKVVAISRKASKKDDALQIGADSYIATDDDRNWFTNHGRSLDIIISTISSSKIPMSNYLSLLCRDGTYIQVAAPDDGLFSVLAFDLNLRRIKLGESYIGSPAEIREMLDLAVEKQVKPWVIEYPMMDANKALVDIGEGKARYRLVLVN